ncbi:MAG: cytochrome c biogenesis protein CcdA [Candidatus Omnitrophota bacterium]
MEKILDFFQSCVVNRSLLAYPLVFFGGILASFTPCFYAVIPITIAFIGASSTNSLKKSFLLTLSYVLGLSVVYSVLGAVASLGGFFFWQIASSVWVYVFLGIVFIVLGFSALGFYNIPFLNFKSTEFKKPRSYAGSFLVGAVSALAIGPCVTPFLGVVLAYAATQKNVVFATSLLFIFSLGMSVLILFLGTFSSELKKMPKLGKFNLVMEKIFGFIMVLAGVFFLISVFKRFV